MMDRSAFWRLIDKVDREALRDGDDEGAVEPLVEALARCGEEDIRAFEDHLAQCLHDIDGRGHAEQAGDAGRSDDGFLYARCYVVASGRAHYERVKDDPKRMPKSLDEWCEPLLFASQRAWAMATGKDEEEWDHAPPVSYETGSNEARWK